MRSCARSSSLACLAATLSAQQAPDRTQPPQPGPPPALKLPAIQKRQLSNGLPVWIVETARGAGRAGQPRRAAAAAADDPPGKFGVASLTAAMLDEGAGARSALEIADAIDFLGADLGATSGIDSSAVRLHVPVARLADALPIMADVALRPTFPTDELERLRQERLTGLLQARDDPPTIASAGVRARALRPGAPLRHADDRHRRDDQGVHRRRSARVLRVGVPAGQRDAARRRRRHRRTRSLPLLENELRRLEGAGPAAHAVEAAAPSQQPPTRQIYLVDKPGAPQSQIRIGWIGVPRSTPDYFPLQVMNTILGGSFTSRLNMNLREKHGYTYGASSAFDMRAAAGPFFAAAGVQTDKTAEALKEFFNELNGDPASRCRPTSCARAKNYVALRFPSAFETTGDISRRLEDVLVYRLPDDYFAKYVQNIQAVTAADVQRVAQKYIQPDKFAVVVVGDLKTIETGIRALNLGPIKVMTIDEVFGPKP